MNDNLNMDYPPSAPERTLVKSAVLLLFSFWHAKYPARKVIELLEKSFTQEDMFEVIVRVSKQLSLNNMVKHQNTERRSREEGQAQTMYQLLQDIGTADRTSQFVVGIGEMEMVQRALTYYSLASGENVQISARLESLEVGLLDLGVKIGKISSVPVNTSTTIPVKIAKETPSITVSDMSHALITMSSYRLQTQKLFVGPKVIIWINAFFPVDDNMNTESWLLY